MSHITILVTQPPYSSSLAKEAQNIALSTSAFFENIKVIFSQEASYQLLNNQTPEKYLYKNFIDTIKSFQWYDIDEIYITSTKIEPQRITAFKDLIPINSLPPVFISSNQASIFIKNSAHCLIY